MWICYNCKAELPSESGTVSALLSGSASCEKCDTDNVMPIPVMEKEAQKEYYNCAIWKEKPLTY